MSRFNEVCQGFGLTIRLKKTQVMGQNVASPPDIRIFEFQLDVVHDFVYLGSTISDSLSHDAELNKRIGKAATTLRVNIYAHGLLCYKYIRVSFGIGSSRIDFMMNEMNDE